MRKIALTIGWFADKKEAAKKYDEAAIQYHGEFAVLNFPKLEAAK